MSVCECVCVRELVRCVTNTLFRLLVDIHTLGVSESTSCYE